MFAYELFQRSFLMKKSNPYAAIGARRFDEDGIFDIRIVKRRRSGHCSRSRKIVFVQEASKRSLVDRGIECGKVRQRRRRDELLQPFTPCAHEPCSELGSRQNHVDWV